VCLEGGRAAGLRRLRACGVRVWLGNTGYVTPNGGAAFGIPNAREGGRDCGRLWICAAVPTCLPNIHQDGKVTVGWLMMNLSSVFRRRFHLDLQGKLSPIKIIAFALGLASVLCLFWGQKSESRVASEFQRERAKRPCVLVDADCFAYNGMSAFGLKSLPGGRFPEREVPYLAIWYAAGLAGVGRPMLLRGMRLSRKDSCGRPDGGPQHCRPVAMAVALDSNVPGQSCFCCHRWVIFVVVLAGRIFFHERMSRLNIIGIIMGFIAVILLGMS